VILSKKITPSLITARKGEEEGQIKPDFDNFVGAGSPEFILPTNNLNKPAPTPPIEFLLPTNNLNKPAPTPPITSIRYRIGAGFYHLSVFVKDIGERAPTPPITSI
jgi:hypothetical protein